MITTRGLCADNPLIYEFSITLSFSNALSLNLSRAMYPLGAHLRAELSMEPSRKNISE